MAEDFDLDAVLGPADEPAPPEPGDNVTELRARKRRVPKDTTQKRDDDAGTGDVADVKKSMSTMLVELAQERYTFGVSDTGETFGVPIAGPKVVHLLRGGKRSLRAQLSREFFRQHGRAAPQQALADAMLVIEGIAQDGDEEELALRVARVGPELWLDLGDDTGAAVKITSKGWSVERQAPVLYKRTALNAPLPEPERGGDVAELWRWLNIAEADRPLLLAWVVSTFFSDIPHPVPGLFAQAGSGKSTAMKILVSIVDPSPVPARKAPRDAEAWVTAAASSWVVGIDNLSTIPGWLSDSICRAVTGDGDVRRRLYTDADLAVFAFRRCIILGGIDVGAIRGDLADRLLPLTLEPIGEADRKEEHELWPAWADAHPRILGAVLDVVAGVAGVLPSVRLESKPRMADFARILAAVDLLHGTNGMARFYEKQGLLARESLTDDPFVTAMDTAFTSMEDRTFSGSSAELLAAVTPAEDGWRPPKEWPRTARQVTQVLRRQAPAMRKAGWSVDDDDGRNKSRVVSWTIAAPPTETAGDSSPPSPPDPPDAVRPGETPAGEPGADPRHAPPDRGSIPASGASSPPAPPQPPPARDPVTRENAPVAGVAGMAGVDCEPSPSADPDTFDAELFGDDDSSAPPLNGTRPCRDCDTPTRDFSGLCAGCVERRRANR